MKGRSFCTFDLLLVSLLWLVWLEYNTHAREDGCRRVRFLEAKTGQYLQGHVFINITIERYTPCEHRCVMESKCVSVNVGPTIQDKVTCELSDSDHLQHSEDLQPRDGWTYRGTENLCCSNPCLNDGKCFMGYSDKKYICECRKEFTGENCGKDIDECIMGNHHCSKNASCTNTAGYFNCTCKQGYHGDGWSCLDIDECSNGVHNCSTNTTCKNTAGGFHCLCKSGFTGNGFLCSDIDECSYNIHDCSKNASCTNTEGHFNCTCNPGYTGDGRSCSDCSSSLHYFKKYQDLATKGARSVETFSVNGSLFLAVANQKGDIDGFDANSYIYKLDDSTGQFSLYQTIASTGGVDIQYFSIADTNYLAVANFYNGSTFQLNSTIYQWNGKEFVLFQNIPTFGATSFNPFKIFPKLFLAVANFNDDTTFSINSVIYKWNGNQFEKFQEIGTRGAHGITAFVINNEYFIAFANHFNTQPGYSVQSSVYKWSENGFVNVESLQTYGAYDEKSFSNNNDTFLVFSNHYDGSSVNIDSYIYKWNGSKFVLFQSIPTRQASSLHPFVICSQTFLGVANSNGTSVVYRFSGKQFIKYQEFSTHEATDMTSFQYNSHTYLVVANQKRGENFNIKTMVYKWV